MVFRLNQDFQNLSNSITSSLNDMSKHLTDDLLEFHVKLEARQRQLRDDFQAELIKSKTEQKAEREAIAKAMRQCAEFLSPSPSSATGLSAPSPSSLASPCGPPSTSASSSGPPGPPCGPQPSSTPSGTCPAPSTSGSPPRRSSASGSSSGSGIILPHAPVQALLNIKQEPLDLDEDDQVDVQDQGNGLVDVPDEFQAPAAPQVAGDPLVGAQAAQGLVQAVPGPSKAVPGSSQGTTHASKNQKAKKRINIRDDVRDIAVKELKRLRKM